VSARGLRELLPTAVAEPLRDWLAERRAAREWKAYRRRAVIPPPHAVKVGAVIDSARRHGIAVLIETGTFEGEMARRCRNAFREIHTIELDSGLARAAVKRLARYPHIHVHQGDSATKLPELLARVTEPALFWLDGHFSGAGTARGASDTPLGQELAAIAAHPVRRHAVLIDDARLLGASDYPALAEIERRIKALAPGYTVRVEDDIVLGLPPLG
jgi:hypothetical protein